MAGNTNSRLTLLLFTQPPFLLCVLLFIAVEGLQKSGISIPFVHWYLNDLIALPILLTCSLFLERLITQNQNLNYGFYRVFAAFLMVSISFEVLFPFFSEKYTADCYDVVSYGAGGGVYFKFMRLK